MSARARAREFRGEVRAFDETLDDKRDEAFHASSSFFFISINSLKINGDNLRNRQVLISVNIFADANNKSTRDFF